MQKIGSLLLLLTLFLVACGSSVEPEAVAVVEAEKAKPQLIKFYTDW